MSTWQFLVLICVILMVAYPNSSKYITGQLVFWGCITWMFTGGGFWALLLLPFAFLYMVCQPYADN